MATSTTPEKIIIDTDPGIDDAMAIAFALLNPDIELLGLTSAFGNVTIDVATRNALALVEMAEMECPVARGAGAPLVQEPHPVADFVHGAEGFGTVEAMMPQREEDPRPAHEFICDQVNAAPGDVVLCPVGPLTNLALALRHDPGIAKKVKAVHVMGASLKEGGNATEFAEANIWQDPHAAEIVLAADWDVRLIGLDVTHRVTCHTPDFESLAEAAPILGGFLNEAVQFYFDFHEKVDGFHGCYMHDPTAVISIIRPDLFSFDEAPVGVIVEGERAGETVLGHGSSGRPAKWASKVDVAAVKDVFLSTIRSGF
ncbi:MAG: nucleoside hydrolase [Pseudomonadota bacterium]